MALPFILVFENDPAAQCVIELTLRQRVACQLRALRYAYELEEALEELDTVSLVMIDLTLPDHNALDLLKEVKRKYPHLTVVITASVRDEKLVQQALESGAADYIRKTDEPARIAAIIQSLLATGHATNQAMTERASSDPFATMVGSSAPLNYVIEQARQAAESDIAVLVYGESGVGKERMSRAIHAAGARAKKPFVAVNCGAIATNLIESTLFGHKRGAFTGATRDEPGKFREAQGGTLFLDEVGELPLDMQVKLLRVLQEKEVEPVGGGAPVPIDVRIVSATHVNLEEAVELGRFREDLFYRLHVFPIKMPSLRERGKADIVMLIQHFIERFAKQEKKPVAGITEAAAGLLTNYHWPGNIRQLENALYRAVVLSKSERLMAEDFVLSSNALQSQQFAHAKHKAMPKTPLPLYAASHDAQPEKIAQPHVLLLNDTGGFKALKQTEQEILTQAVVHYRWRITDIAQALGVTRATIYKKMKEAELRDPREG